MERTPWAAADIVFEWNSHNSVQFGVEVGVDRTNIFSVCDTATRIGFVNKRIQQRISRSIYCLLFCWSLLVLCPLTSSFVDSATFTIYGYITPTPTKGNHLFVSFFPFLTIFFISERQLAAARLCQTQFKGYHPIQFQHYTKLVDLCRHAEEVRRFSEWTDKAVFFESTTKL